MLRLPIINQRSNYIAFTVKALISGLLFEGEDRTKYVSPKLLYDNSKLAALLGDGRETRAC